MASLTKQLLSSDRAAYQRATQSPFLAAAARGSVPRDTLGTWLANDRMYIHSYIRGAGLVLASHELPPASSELARGGSSIFRLFDWIIEGLANVRREESFFVDAAARYGIAVDLPTDGDGIVVKGAKLEGLKLFEGLFSQCGAPSEGKTLPWLEDAVVFWATEKCYLDAWTWARSQTHSTRNDPAGDEDGGALRVDFIPNWSSPEFGEFVDRLGAIIDDAVEEQVQREGGEVRASLVRRAEVKWTEVLRAEEMFWPNL